MDIVRTFLGFALATLALGLSACGSESGDTEVGHSQAMGGAFAEAGSVADASMATGSGGGTANGGAAGSSSSAVDAHPGSGGSAFADVTVVSQVDAKADAVTDARVSADGPTCLRDPGTCDCIAVCYVSSDCPAGRTCQCEMGPCFCHRCVP